MAIPNGTGVVFFEHETYPTVKSNVTYSAVRNAYKSGSLVCVRYDCTLYHLSYLDEMDVWFIGTDYEGNVKKLHLSAFGGDLEVI